MPTDPKNVLDYSRPDDASCARERKHIVVGLRVLSALSAFLFSPAFLALASEVGGGRRGSRAWAYFLDAAAVTYFCWSLITAIVAYYISRHATRRAANLALLVWWVHAVFLLMLSGYGVFIYAAVAAFLLVQIHRFRSAAPRV